MNDPEGVILIMVEEGNSERYNEGGEHVHMEGGKHI